jgi:shikimate dehydrogenase
VTLLLRTYLVGLIGRGIGGSRSPEMHEREAAALGLPLVYRIIDFDRLGYADDRLEGVLKAMQAIGFDGSNITHPFKQRVITSLDTLSEDAATLGAVNTVVFRDGRATGHNTDWSGFRASFARELPGVALGTIAQIGSGGAGSAIAYALLTMGVGTLRIFDLDRDRAEALAERLARQFPNQAIVGVASAAEALAGADGIVQTSPVGMGAHPGVPFDPALLDPAMWLAEIIYFPIETDLLRAARAIGCRTLSGGGMAVAQAADAFAKITGTAPDLERMIAAF